MGCFNETYGCLIMSHSDDNGLILPPLLAPIQIVIIPLIKNGESSEKIQDKTKHLFNLLKEKGVRVKIDDRENMSLGFKLNDSEVKGIPMRIVIGKKELEKDEFDIFYRHNLEKVSTKFSDLTSLVESSINRIQEEMILKSKERLKKTYSSGKFI